MSPGGSRPDATGDDVRRERDERTIGPDSDPSASGPDDPPAGEDDDLETMLGGLGDDEATIAQIPDSEQPTGEVETAEVDMATHTGIHPGTTPGTTLGTTLGEDEATMAGPAPTERRTRGVETRRDEGTLAGDFAGTTLGAVAPDETMADDDEDATVYDPGLAEELSRRTDATRRDPVAGTQRHGDATAAAATQGGSETARDPAAAGYTERGGHAGQRVGPIRLAENEPLGRYILTKRLGKGGMGEVWKARHNMLKGDRAIKVIKASISRDKQFRHRFINEGQTMMRVKHPGVVEVTDLDQTRVNGELFMVMEYLEGRTLYEAIRDSDAPLSADPRNVARIYRDLALGMQVIHEARIVHKDLKSDNALLVLGRDGLEHPKVIDFGLAKHLDDADRPPEDAASEVDGTYEPDLRTTLSGTLAYMAPEQFLGEASTFQTDIYAFGVMLYECFMKGEYPMARGGLAHYIQMHADGVRPKLLQAARPELDRDLVDISDRCMAPRRADRPESFQQVADALQYWLDAPERTARKKRILGLAAAAVFLISVAVWGVLFTESKAAVGGTRVAVGDRLLEPVAGAVHLHADALASVEVSATLDGDAKGPFVTVDGERVAADFRVEAGRLVADLDLSALSEGRHELAVYATDGGKTTPLAIVADRSAPSIRELIVPGSRGADAAASFGGHSAAAAPDVRVRFDEATIARVFARVDGVEAAAAGSPASEDGPRDMWIIPSTAKQPGEIKMEVEARDHAGNVTTRRFRYVHDTAAPLPNVTDFVDGDAPRIPVRSGVGARLTVGLSEAGRAVLSIGGAAPLELASATADALDFDLPSIPPGGLVADLRVEDLAGNAWERRRVRIEVVPDVASLLTVEDRAPRRILSDEREIRLILHRSYDVLRGGVMGKRTHDARGVPVQESRSEINVGEGAATRFETEITVQRTELSEGTWLLEPTGQGAAEPRSFKLIIDATRPSIDAIVVRDEDGDTITEGGWSHSRRVFIDVTASDVTMREIAVEGAGAFNGPFNAGANTHRFELVCDRDGLTKTSITVTDAAGNPATSRSLNIRADSSDPDLDVRMGATPVSGRFNDQNGVNLTGRVGNEARYRVYVEIPAVEGVAARTVETNFTKADFQLTSLPVPAGRHTLQIWATDDSGRRSTTRSIAVDVERLDVELPQRFDWAGGAASTMQKIEPGDVVVGGRVFPVERVYIDRTEVTNAQYRAFLEATGGRRDARWSHADTPADWSHVPPAATWGDPKWNAPELPVVNAAYWDGYAFARWSGRRLPTEAEWVKAAVKQEGEPELRRWPFGNEWTDGILVTAEALVGSPIQAPRDATSGADESPFHCLHMGGNVSEWVDLERVPEGSPTTAVRGGNWYLSAAAANVRDVPAKRYDRSQRHATIGFRCVAPEDAVRGRLGAASPEPPSR